MKVEYSEHIKNRLKFRKIDYDLPKIIFEQSEGKFFDTETGHFIAVMNNINLLGYPFDSTKHYMLCFRLWAPRVHNEI